MRGVGGTASGWLPVLTSLYRRRTSCPPSSCHALRGSIRTAPSGCASVILVPRPSRERLSVVDVVVQRPARRAVMVVVAAVTLGVLAFTADAIDGSVARLVVTALVSSGLAWGLAALLAGWAAPDHRRAATGATSLLVVATLVYYLLILLV